MRLELTLRWDCGTSNFAGPPPLLSFCSEIGDGHNGAPLYFRRSFLCRTKESLSFSVPLRSCSWRFWDFREDEDEQRAAWDTSDRCRGWEGRANRPQLGLFASYRVGVKINVNFAVELISPAPINPTNSLCLLPFPPLFLSFRSSFYIAFPLRVSLYLFPSLAFPTDAPLRTFPLVLRFHTLNLPQGFPWNSKTFAVRKSTAYRRPLARSCRAWERPFQDRSLQESARFLSRLLTPNSFPIILFSRRHLLGAVLYLRWEGRQGVTK